jgi:hypothetical protein
MSARLTLGALTPGKDVSMWVKRHGFPQSGNTAETRPAQYENAAIDVCMTEGRRT